MSCILCFSLVSNGEHFGIHDYGEASHITVMELIQKHFAFSEVFRALFLFFRNFQLLAIISANPDGRGDEKSANLPLQELLAQSGDVPRLLPIRRVQLQRNCCRYEGGEIPRLERVRLDCVRGRGAKHCGT